MTQEDKELLLKDLCARLSYGVIISPIDCGKAKLIGFKDGYPILFDLVSQKEYDKPWEIEYIQPYLRPMSSMTEEEKEELLSLMKEETKEMIELMRNDDFGVLKGKYHFNCLKELNWLLKNHFDYRGLIEKGLAIEVTKENNPYKEE